MKKIIAFILVFVVAASCTKLEDLNKNIKDPTSVPGESLFTGAQANLFDQMVSTNVNNNVFRLFAQYWTETTYIDESNYDLTTRSIPDNHWNVLYRDVLMDLKEASIIIEKTDYTPDGDNGEGKKNRLAIVEVMSIYTWTVLVETFGNVPYSQSLDITNVHPAYDDAMSVYKDLIIRLNAAISNMSAGHASLGIADNMYQGDVASWLKFANSLKLRMGLLIADADNALAKTTVEAAAAGVFTSNADNAKIVYMPSAPYSNPVYDDLVASGRNDFVPTSVIVDPMNTLNDPRRPFYFALNDTTVYIGGVYGASNDYTKFSHVSDKIKEATFEGTIFDYSEVEFLLAEACERGYTVGGTAAGHYDNAIKASITYWGGTDAEATAYLGQSAVAYATAAGNWKQKIGTQKWYALYNRGFEAWTEWRKFDYPVLVAPPDANSDIPKRYTYPVAEQTLNAAQWTAASAAIGGDDVATKLFFDKN
jgi:hypothetical protein